MAHPKHFEQMAMHRLIADRPEDKTIFETLNLPNSVLTDLVELDAGTNPRISAEHETNPWLSARELLYGVPYARVVNAAFTHCGPGGSRFSDSHRGAWYAAKELKTSILEVSYHKRRFLNDMGIREPRSFLYVDYLADFAGDFHVLEPEEQKACLQADPVPQCYAEPQKLAASLLRAGSCGIVYTSVRHAGGICIACFRPSLVFHPRRGESLTIEIHPDS